MIIQMMKNYWTEMFKAKPTKGLAEEQRQPSWIRYNTNINTCSCLKSSDYSQHKFQKTYYISSKRLSVGSISYN